MTGRRLGYVLKRFPRISETFVATEIIELERQGEEVTIFAVSRPEEAFTHRFLDELRAPVVYLPHRPSRQPVRVARAVGFALRGDARGWGRVAVACVWPPRRAGVRRLLQASVLHQEMARAGITHAHAHFATAAARLANLTWRMGGPTYSVTAHAKDVWHEEVQLDHLRDKLAPATFVATVSEANRAYLAGILGAEAPRVVVVPNSVDERRFAPVARRDSDRVVTVGRLIEKKGIGDLVEACARLHDQGIGVRLEVIGNGPLRPHLEQAAAAAGLDVAFRGPLPHEEVVAGVAGATVFCLPCVVAGTGDRDGLPTAVLEAMALGVPVVTTAVNGLADAVVDGDSGLTVPERDPAALAAALARLLGDPALADRLGANGRRRVEERFALHRSVAMLRRHFPTGRADVGAASPPGAPTDGGRRRPTGGIGGVMGGRPRLAYLTTDRGIAYGGTKGAAVHLGEITAALAGRGVDVLVLAAAVAPGAVPPAGVTVEVLPRAGKGGSIEDWLAAEAARAGWLAERLARFDPVCLHERFALHSAAGSVAARRAGVPHLVELNAPLVEEAARYRTLEQPDEARRLERAVLAAADVVLPVSRPLADHARALGAQVVEVLPNAVAIDCFPAPPTRPPGSPLTAVLAGTLRPWHGVEVVAEAWPLLGADAPRLLVVGDGPGRRALEKVGAEVTGAVDHAQVPALLQRADIGIAPYTADGPRYFSPLKVFEYLAAGLAVVAADLPGVTDVVDERSAVLMPAGSAPALAAAVAGLVAHPERRPALGRAGRSLVAGQHTWDHRARRVLELAGRCRATAAATAAAAGR